MEEYFIKRGRLSFWIYLLFILLLASPLFAALSPSSQNITEFKKNTKKLVNDPQNDGQVNPFPPNSPANKAYRRYYVEVLNNDLVLSQLYNFFVKYQGSVGNIWELYRAYLTEATAIGLKKLPEKEIEDYLIIYFALIEKLSIRECGDFFKSSNFTLYLKIGLLDKKAIDRYFQISTNSLLLGVKGAHDPLPLSPEQIKVANEIYESQFDKKDQLEIDRIMKNKSAASDLEICWANKTAVSKILTMKDEPRRWFIRYFQQTYFK